MHRFHTLLVAARSTAATSLVALASLTVSGCNREKPISTEGAGHRITAKLEGQLKKVESRTDDAVVASEFGHVTIERNRVRIDGEPWVGIADGSAVSITIERGRTSVQAGNVSIRRSVSD